MAAFSNEQFYDHTDRSPRSFRNPQMSRQPGRGDGYSTMPGMFGQDGGLAGMRFGGPGALRDPFGTLPQNMAINNLNFPYDANAAQSWGAPAGPNPSFGNAGINPLNNGDFGGPTRGVKPSRGRAPLNTLWPESNHFSQQPAPSILAPRAAQQSRQDNPEDDEELIPTAIVIKNIPFAVKKEQLVQLMVDMNLPLPYAFNYHFDNGVFRGLAFANFTSPQETDQVIQALNHMELSGRKLRVEYKKMLPLAERERIEREKRERRGQLEEQHRPVVQTQLASQLSLSSVPRNTPSPLSARAGNKPEVDMNDPKTLELYTDLSVFARSNDREVLIFPATLEPWERRVVHTLAHHMGLQHTSRGTGDQRQVHIHRPAPGANVSPPAMAGAFYPNENNRPPVTRTSTGDFGEGRSYEPMPFNQNFLRGQSSVGLLDVDGGYGRNTDSSLRNAKSFADLRSWSPSPVPSSASFPAALQTNGSRLQAQAAGLNDTAGSNTPTITPTTSNPGGPSGRDDQPFLISGLSNLSMGTNSGANTSPRRNRGMFGAGSAWDDNPSFASAGPIGSKRTVSIGPEPSNPLRQSRGPSSANAVGFRRPNGRGSDEMRSAASAIAE